MYGRRLGAFAPAFPGQRRVVSLPASQQRVLDEIESDLEGCEPRLRMMFAIFTRLNRDEGAPRTESLQPGPRSLRAVIAIPLVMGLVALCVFLAISSSAVRSCSSAVGLHAIPTARASTCQPVLESPSRS
jgi:hypothetical protein